MKNQKTNPQEFLDATELSPLENLEVKGGADKKKEKKVEVK